jgi:H+/Cl- antiporter ClcA
VFGFNRAINPLFGSNSLLYHCGTVAAISGCFGTPLTAICLAIEILLSEWTIGTIIPVLLAAAVGTLPSWLMQGSVPLFTITIKEPVIWSAGLAIGVLIGLWATATIRLTKVFKRWLGALVNKSYWWLLIPAVVACLVWFYSPNHITNLNGYMEDLLQARVTLFLLFSLALLNWLTWSLYNAGFGTGAGILPLLLNGGAWALFAGLLIQLSVPSLKLDAVFMVLLGMTAMFAAGSRALLTALVLGLELSGSVDFILPGTIACVTAYGLSYLLTGKQRSSLNAPAL